MSQHPYQGKLPNGLDPGDFPVVFGPPADGTPSGGQYKAPPAAAPPNAKQSIEKMSWGELAVRAGTSVPTLQAVADSFDPAVIAATSPKVRAYSLGNTEGLTRQLATQLGSLSATSAQGIGAKSAMPVLDFQMVSKDPVSIVGTPSPGTSQQGANGAVTGAAMPKLNLWLVLGGAVLLYFVLRDD